MRRAFLFCLAIAFAIACGDNITEPVPDRTPSTPSVAFATTTTEDGLSISTDKDDYQPGDVVHFTGYGWQPYDVLDIVLTDEPATAEPHSWSVSVGADGMFHDSTYVVDEGDLNVAFTLVATSRLTGRSLTVNFTDSQPQSMTVTATNGTVTQGGSATYNVAVTVNGNSGNCTMTFSVAPLPTGATATFSGGATITTNANFTKTLTIATLPSTPTASTTFTVSIAKGTDCQSNNQPPTATGTIVVQAPANVPPNSPAALAQFRSNGTTSIPTGGASNEVSVVFKAIVVDADAGNTIKLEVEVKPTGTVFANTASAVSTVGVATGNTASATVTGLSNGASYHWQARAVDNNGAASAWVSFGGNAETAADFMVDTDAPGVAINQAGSQADPTNASPINFDVAFTKPVTGFATGDVTLGGTAGATTATVTPIGPGGLNYNVAVTGMTSDGTVIASIAAGVAVDGAGNSNVASTSTDNTVTYDKTRPTVTINQAAGQDDPTNGSTINFTVVFSETVNNFVTGDVLLSGTASPTTATVTGSGTTYNVAVSGMTVDGTVIADVGAGVATDAAGNLNVASTSTDNTVTYDHTPPTVTINQAAAQADPAATSPINFTVVFSEAVTDFVTGDVSLSGTAGATTAAVTGSGTTYNVAVSGMTSSGTVISVIGANKATDAAGNGNTASSSTDNTVSYDLEPPIVSNVAVNPNPTNGTIAVTATAKVDDGTTGNSKIVSAFYKIDGGAEIAMAASDGSFSSATENVTATIPASVVAALSNGTHQVCVRGVDAAGNSSAFSDTGACATLTVDKEPPVVSNVAVTPSPTNGTIAVTATAKVDDATTGSSKIVSAYYSIDGGTAIAMAASDGSFSSATENVTATIPAASVAALSNGTHQVCVKGTDEAGNTSSFSDTGACATLTVDKEPPVVSNVAVSPSPTNGTIAVTATAKVDDAATGSSKIVSAYYSIDGGAAVAMAASDGGFDEATENVTASIPAATVAALSNGDHQVCVKGKDEAGNTSLFSVAGACANLRVDKEPPVVTNVAAVPNPTNGSINVTATATVNDAASGNSDVVSAVYSIDGGTTHPMTAVDGTFNSATENVTATIPAATVAGLSNGTHRVCVSGTDAAGNASVFSAGTCTNLIIDKEPPAVSNVAVGPNLTNGSINVTATAKVDDAATGSSAIIAAYYSIDGGAAVAMTASDGTFDDATENVTATIPAATVHALDEGEHKVCVKGKDLAGNMSSFADVGACATLTIDKTPPEVTINQKSGQADPTNASPINFTVVFTENVSDFATGDVTLGGPAAAGATATVTGSGTTYYVSVSGMTADGALTASIATGVAHDAAGNGNNASTSSDNSVVYDHTPPVIACGTADGNWHAADASIACTASDVTSNLKNSADASFSLTTSVAAGTETSNALTNSRDIYDNAGNSSTAGPVGGNKIDKKAPVVSLTCPANLVILNANANANWTATDGGSGVTPSGTVALATNSIGPKTANVAVQDAVGNSSSSSCGYTVGYNFAGFSAPVDRPNTYNLSKAGQAIPLKWRLTDAAGRPITDLTSVTVQALALACDQGTSQDQIEEYAAGASGLQNLGDGYYQFNWKTPTTYAGSCKSIALAFGSGGLGYTEKPAAFFTFKK